MVEASTRTKLKIATESFDYLNKQANKKINLQVSWS